MATSVIVSELKAKIAAGREAREALKDVKNAEKKTAEEARANAKTNHSTYDAAVKELAAKVCTDTPVGMVHAALSGLSEQTREEVFPHGLPGLYLSLSQVRGAIDIDSEASDSIAFAMAKPIMASLGYQLTRGVSKGEPRWTIAYVAPEAKKSDTK